MELKEKILNIIIDSDDRSLDYGVTAAKILEQVEAGYISKEEHEEIKWQKEAAEEQINGYWKPNLERAKEAIEQLKANSIPKDRVREMLEEVFEYLQIEYDEDGVPKEYPNESWVKAYKEQTLENLR